MSLPDPVAPDTSAVRAALLQLRCQQGVRVPYVVLVLSASIVRLLWEYWPAGWLLTWAVSVCAVLFFRSLLFNRYAERPPQAGDVERIGRIMTGLSFLTGLIGGSAGWLFFRQVPLVEQALLSMILVCWSAIAVGTTSATPRNFLVFALPLLGPLGYSWLAADIPQGPYIGALIFFFLLIQQLIAHDNGTQLLRSILIRQENRALIDELQREREEANAARETAEAANRAKSRFLAAASHDLRQPMHALSLYSAALSGTVTQPRVHKIAQNIGVCVESLDNLFEALLDISRLDAGLVVPKPRDVEIQTLLDRLNTEFSPQAKARGLSLVVGRHAGRITTDPVIVERIVRNLLDNAVRYTRRGSITLAARDANGVLEISVADTGVGIAPREQERVFEEFHQVGTATPQPHARMGMGLGLATVRRMAGLLGGHVRLESVPGAGSTFTLSLASRAQRPARAVPAAGPMPSAVDLRARVVLVIEDDANAREAMRTILSAWGCTCLSAGGIEEAREAVRTAPRPPDILLVDYRLGEGVSGVDAIAAVCALAGEVPAILITGATDLRPIGAEPGSAHRLLHKPLKAAVLRAEIERVLAGNAPDDGAPPVPVSVPG